MEIELTLKQFLKQVPAGLKADVFQDGNEVINLLRPITSHGSSQKCDN
jgi:hypothetical protein